MWNRTRTRLRMEWSNLVEVPRRRQPRFLVDRLIRLGQFGLLRIETRIGRLTSIPHSQAYYREQIAVAHEKAYEAYSPKPYSGRVTMVRAERQPLGRVPDGSLGWGQFVEGDIDVIEAPGHRLGLLSEPRVGRVAERIHGAMEEALADAGRSDR
jgi:thioesterase domain-containing protein